MTNNVLFPNFLDPVVPSTMYPAEMETESQLEFGAMQAVARSSVWMRAWDALSGCLRPGDRRGRVGAPRATLPA